MILIKTSDISAVTDNSYHARMHYIFVKSYNNIIIIIHMQLIIATYKSETMHACRHIIIIILAVVQLPFSSFKFLLSL